MCNYCSHGSIVIWVWYLGYNLLGSWGKNRFKIIVALDLPFIRDTTNWLQYMFGLGPTDWMWRVKWRVTGWQGWTYCVDLLGIPLVRIWGCTGYFPSMGLRQFGGNQHVSWLNDLSVIICDYRLLDIDTVIIDSAFGFLPECRSTIDYPTCPGDNYTWSTTKFKKWRVNRAQHVFSIWCNWS